jgi:hypothetical protein
LLLLLQELASTQDQVQASIVKLVEAVHGTLQAQQEIQALRSRSQSSEVIYCTAWLLADDGFRLKAVLEG